MSAPTLDLKSAHAWPLHFSDAASREDDASRWITARFNHKPRARNTIQVKVRPDASEHNTILSLKDGDDTYTYRGECEEAADDAYVLYFSGEGKDRGVVLQKLDSAHAYNMISDAQGADEDDLLKKYPQLTLMDADNEEDLFGDSDADGGPVDADNPFDYRHYLDDEEEEPVVSKTKENIAPSSRPSARPEPLHPLSNADKRITDLSNTKSPRSVPAASKSTSIFQSKRKTVRPNAKNQGKRVKAGSDDDLDSTLNTPNPSSIPRSNTKIDIPQVRLDRKASLRRPSFDDDDSGELILENETPISDKPPARHGAAMSLALSGQLGQGPISLRSAANSPAGRIASASPMLPRHGDDIDIDMDVDMEDSASPDELALGPPSHHPPPRSTLARLAAAEQAADDAHFNSMQHDTRASESPSPLADEDDFERDMMEAFENDDDNLPGTAPANESEEESEEE